MPLGLWLGEALLLHDTAPGAEALTPALRELAGLPASALLLLTVLEAAQEPVPEPVGLPVLLQLELATAAGVCTGGELLKEEEGLGEPAPQLA